jgi:hypothetical protein
MSISPQKCYAINCNAPVIDDSPYCSTTCRIEDCLHKVYEYEQLEQYCSNVYCNNITNVYNNYCSYKCEQYVLSTKK